jgi:hypothetical protein
LAGAFRLIQKIEFVGLVDIHDIQARNPSQGFQILSDFPRMGEIATGPIEIGA